MVDQQQYMIVEECEEPEVRTEASVEDLSDLTMVTKKDVLGKADGNTDADVSDLVSMSDKDVDDLVEVTNADIMGESDIGQPKPKKMRKVRVVKRPMIPPTSVGGIGS